MEKNCCFFNKAYLFIMIHYLISGFQCLKDVRIEGGNYVRAGEDVLYDCKYDLEGELLYVVKWYFGQSEFYRFVPKEVPPQQVFGGLNVDVRFSNDHQVFLRNVTFELSGYFRCAVSVEFTFQTCEAYKNLTVVDIGYEAPKIVLKENQYHPGEEVEANCTLEKSFPHPNLTWFINDHEVKRELGDGFGSVLRFQLPSNFLPTSLSCHMVLFDIYDEISTVRIQPIPRKISLRIQSPNNFNNNNDSTQQLDDNESSAFNKKSSDPHTHTLKSSSGRAKGKKIELLRISSPIFHLFNIHFHESLLFTFIIICVALFK